MSVTLFKHSLIGFITLYAAISFELLSKEIPYQSEWLKVHYHERMQRFAQQPLQKGSIVFIGDSITEQGMNWAVRFDDLRVRNRGISGDMTYGVLARLDEMKAAAPKAIFLLIGVNDIFNLYYQQEVQSLVSISRNIEKITTQLHQSLPDTQIFVQSILPDHRDFITVMASSVNQQIKNIKNKKFTYIDMHDLFKSPQGTLNPKFTTDGTHLNRLGYERWKQHLKPIMEKL